MGMVALEAYARLRDPAVAGKQMLEEARPRTFVGRR
jgi:hypothetical protein